MPQTSVSVFRQSPGDVPLMEWLNQLEEREPRAYAKCLAKILRLAELGSELRRPEADMLRDGIKELRIKHRHVNYRILCFFHGKNVVCLSHGLTKEDVVPDADIETAIERKVLVMSDPDKYTTEWDV